MVITESKFNDVNYIVQSNDNVKIDGIEDALIELIYMIAFFFIILLIYSVG